MRITEQITKGFDDLLRQGEQLLAARQNNSHIGQVAVVASTTVDSALAEEWATSCLNFLGRSLGKDSEHYLRFFGHVSQVSLYRNAEKANATLKAAKSDYDGGYLFDMRRAIEADVFDDFLEQADYLLSQNYFQVASVVAGVVLEDGLRKLCQKNSIPLAARPKLDTMNADLAKAGIYDKGMQKKITWLADIRNKAAHGEWDKFTSEDAKEMIVVVRRFMTDYL